MTARHPHSLLPLVDYNAVIPFKYRLLEKAWTNFVRAGSAELRVAFEQFCHEQAHWLEDYALFRALKIRYNGAYYLEWPTELVQRVPKALAQARRDLANQVDQVCFAQFLLFRQGARLEKHARAKGMRLIGDLPFFVSPDSSDVWANPELFLLDDQRKPRFVAGVPPDYFSAQGQLWGNPVYNWDSAAANWLSLVHRSFARSACARRCDSSGSFSRVRSGVACSGRGTYRAVRPVGTGSGS